MNDRPMAAPGLISYRYAGRYGWVMIGARDNSDALREAERSLDKGDGKASLLKLQLWDGYKYVNAL